MSKHFSFDYELRQPDEWIVAAAVKYGDVIAMAEQPGRHHTVMHEIHRQFGARTGGDREQGFVTSRGRFVDREEGCIIARAAGQIVQKHGPDTILFSEDMW